MAVGGNMIMPGPDPFGPTGYPGGGGGFVPPRWPGGIDPSNPGNLPIPIGAHICGPGQRCIGLSVNTPIGSACLGTCVDSAPLPQPDPRTPDGFVPPTDPAPTGPTPGVCDIPTRAFCQATCGTNGNGGGGSGCCKKSEACQLPNGRMGKTNKTRYYRFGDCRRGTSAGVVEPNTVCVTPRRKNYGNIKALRSAISRANGFDRIVKRNRKALRKLATI